jgi:hypothetical protein
VVEAMIRMPKKQYQLDQSGLVAKEEWVFLGIIVNFFRRIQIAFPLRYKGGSLSKSISKAGKVIQKRFLML